MHKERRAKLAITKIHAIKSTLSKAIAYIENPEKTDGQLLVSGYNVDPQMASVDFEMTASLSRHVHHTGKRSTNLAYHMIQSFSPNDVVTPEQAHELGRQLAAQFTDGRFEYVVVFFTVCKYPTRNRRLRHIVFSSKTGKYASILDVLPHYFFRASITIRSYCYKFHVPLSKKWFTLHNSIVCSYILPCSLVDISLDINDKTVKIPWRKKIYHIYWLYLN